jgi:hypothetical protein
MQKFKTTFLNSYIKEIHKKSLSLLCIYLICIVTFNFYIKEVLTLLIIEFLLFYCLISCIQSIKCNFKYKKFIFSSNSEELLETICTALENKIKQINFSLIAFQCTLAFVLFDIVTNLNFNSFTYFL